MISGRDLLAVLTGYLAAAALFVVLGAGAPAVTFLAGALLSALIAASALRRQFRENEAATIANDHLKLELMGAWGDVDRLRSEIGLAPLSRPSLSDLSRNVRRQEETCSSSRSSAA